MKVNEINVALGNYGNTIDSGNPINLFNGNDNDVEEFVRGIIIW